MASLFSKQLIHDFPIKTIFLNFIYCSPFPPFTCVSFKTPVNPQLNLSRDSSSPVRLSRSLLARIVFLNVLSCRRAFISVLYQLVKRQRTSTERERNPINNQISPCIVTNPRAGFDRTLIRSRAFLENRK